MDEKKTTLRERNAKPKATDEPKTTLRERNTNPENLAEENNKKGRCFAFILYPEDGKHMNILRMLNRYPAIFSIAYICHDKDSWTEEDEKENPEHVAGTLKKPHYHVLCQYNNPTTACAFSAKIGGVYCQLVHDKMSYLLYMLHDTPETWDKWQYLPEQMKGDSKLTRLLSRRNDYYI